MDFFYSIAGFVLSIGILVIFHEFGHFIIARLCGVKVMKFSIGFGPSKVLWKDRLGTEYLISAIPLGGYIELLDTSDQNSTSSGKLEDHLAIDKKSPWIRVGILLGGPLANLLLAVLLYWLVFLLGISSTLPFINQPAKGSIAELAKLKSGLRITKVAGVEVSSWEDVASNIMKRVITEDPSIEVETYDAKTNLYSLHNLDLSQKFYSSRSSYKAHVNSDILNNIGLQPLVMVDNKVWKVYPGYPAFKAGIKQGDLLLAIDDQLINQSLKVTDYLQDKLGKEIVLKIDRNGKLLYFKLAPIIRKNNDPNDSTSNLATKDHSHLNPIIGIQFRSKSYPKEYTVTHKFGFKDAFFKSIAKTKDNILSAMQLLYSTITGKLSLNNAAGPIAIGYYAGQNMKYGIEYFLNFLGLISINLGILNLLPIPWLDGGSIVYCFYEILFKKPASIKLINLIKALSLSLLIILAVLTVFNDIAKL